MSRLEPFDPTSAATISAWARTADEASDWCSLTTVPVPAEVIAGWSDDADVEAHVLREHGDLVAYGEVWIDHDEDEVELGHLIVDPARRGQGVGRRLTRALVEAGRTHHDAVHLRVAPENAAALRCYEAAGFTRVDEAVAAAWNVGQPRAYVWMTAG